MNYLAIGDSISIDDYTEVVGGGAVSQFARLIGAHAVEDLTRDGCTTEGVLQALQHVRLRPDIVTLTAGGNDLLLEAFWLGNAQDMILPVLLERAAQAPLDNLNQIATRLAEFCCPVIFNTIYDPTDGQDALAGELGISPQWRVVYNRINDGLRELARQHRFLLSDLELLFRGHGIQAKETWITMQIEPNYVGATAIARHWHRIWKDHVKDPAHGL